MIARALLAVVLATAAAVGCRKASPPPAAPPAEPKLVTSNVERRDYAGSAACASCHADIHAKWERSPMRNMTRAAVGDAVKAPFDGGTFHFRGDKVTLETHDGRRYMRLAPAEGSPQLFRVTKVIGGRYREDYVGVEVDGTGADAKPKGDPTDEPVLPVSWLLFAKKWRYKGYSVMVRERAHLAKHGAPWKQTCIFCHNTEPYLATVYDDLLGGGRSYQGSVSDGLLPPARKWRVEASRPDLLGKAIADELAFLKAAPAREGAPVEEALEQAVRATHDRFGEAQLVEIGVGCEACHNGARQHVEDPSTLPSFEPRSAFLKSSAPREGDKGHAPTHAEHVNHVCVRCHTVLFSKYPYTWEGGLRAKHPGGSSINSGEARDFSGGCTGGMSCVSCHDPHGEDSREVLDRLATVAGNDKCTGCHAAYREPKDRAHHTHHAPDGEGSACLGCHMPRKNAGLSYRLTRYHRIGSPTEAQRVLKDRPLECAVCHADKSVEDLVSTMEGWWHKRYDRAVLRDLYGDDLAKSPILGALRGKPHEQLLAAALLRDQASKVEASAAWGAGPPVMTLLPVLGSDYPLVRYWAHDAMEHLLGKPLPIDLDAVPEAVAAEASIQLEKGTPPR